MTDAPVARGKIKVDARRALGKLRDHMLVDPHLYATEIARAAVALGATSLDLDWDADDVRIGFAGAALDMSAVARLRDHVLAGESSDAMHGALRALGRLSFSRLPARPHGRPRPSGGYRGRLTSTALAPHFWGMANLSQLIQAAIAEWRDGRPLAALRGAPAAVIEFDEFEVLVTPQPVKPG